METAQILGEKGLQQMRQALETLEIDHSIMAVSREEHSFSQSMKRVERMATKMKTQPTISSLKIVKGSLLQPR